MMTMTMIITMILVRVVMSLNNINNKNYDYE